MPFLGARAAVRLFIGGQAWSVQGERDDLGGDRCFTAARPAQAAWDGAIADAAAVLLDSGAFTDPPSKRLTPAQALRRQLAWEVAAGQTWGAPGWQAAILVSYDRLIDEVWTPAGREKRRWSVTDAESAVQETISAAAYLAQHRDRLAPRTLMLSCQGVDAAQYERCVRGVLAHSAPGDWIGLGGWCILGRYTSWLPVFFDAMARALPLIASAGVRHVHLLGVLYLPAVGGLLWLADQYGITVSTDSSAPVLACTRGNLKKAGARAPYWRDNVAVWAHCMATLRETRYYSPPQWQRGLLWEGGAA